MVGICSTGRHDACLAGNKAIIMDVQKILMSKKIVLTWVSMDLAKLRCVQVYDRKRSVKKESMDLI
jgi:hypothetical protein